MNSSPEAILDFWFEGVSDEARLAEKPGRSGQWFAKSEAFDEEIRQKFLKDWQEVRGQGDVKNWRESSLSRLALILLTDQFPRNMFRGRPEMFATDAQACELSLLTLKKGDVTDYDLIHQVFFFMPLMHAEDKAMQVLSVEQFDQIRTEARTRCPHNQSSFERNYAFACRHKEIIDRFGRFPHRNQILGRISSLEEEAFLKQPGSSF